MSIMQIPSTTELAATAQHVADHESAGARKRAALLIAGAARDAESVQDVVAAVEHCTDPAIRGEAIALLVILIVPPRDDLLDRMAAEFRDGQPSSEEMLRLQAGATVRESLELGRMTTAERKDRVARWLAEHGDVPPDDLPRP